jgi:hypothetical protein
MGSLLVCSWPHYVGQNHFFVKILFNKDSAIQSASRRFCTVYKSKNFGSYQPSGRCDIPSRRPTVQSIISLDDENFSSEPSSVSRSFKLFQLASIRTFQQHVRTTLGVQPAMGFPSKTQLWEDRSNRPDALIHKASITFKSRCPDISLLGSDERASDMEIVCIRSTVRTTIPLIWTRETLIWKLLATEVRQSKRQGTTVQTWLKSGKNFNEIFGKPIA